ncbi:hypothetical protein SBRV1_gp53 [Sulfolobales Beppu rod-shaped virus 1]|uniref:Uncharacterized protein n=1 Tax=Sulfolobales Beppu rod-shaped virus 1 TaxID=2493121 RepID=A0A3S8NFE3_9VIRU|nr:hypothetical protein QIT32_gp53 [Sulfolobales Beppu rod-shaped virus 1]AZI75942.1 hypothetical protein SBRV1_gp53 [Sulfolobales Beppu rod-shaped virus 1]
MGQEEKQNLSPTEMGDFLQTPTSKGQNLKPIKLEFEFRRTSMRAVSDTVLISFRTKQPVKAHLHTSKSGRHGTINYFVFPAKYLQYQAERSNLGNVYIYVRVIEVTSEGLVKELQKWKLYDMKSPANEIYNLPENIRQLLISNKEHLPLIEYVEDLLLNRGEE